MDENATAFGRLWRRVVGIGAFALFLSGLLVALGLEELLVLVVLLVGLCVLAGLVTWLLARYRRELGDGVSAGARAATHVGARGSQVGWGLTRRGSRAGWEATRRGARDSTRIGRALALAVVADVAVTARVGRELDRRSGPAIVRASRGAAERARVLAGAIHRQVSRLVDVVAADIHTHRESIRTSRTQPRERDEREREARRRALRRLPR